MLELRREKDICTPHISEFIHTIVSTTYRSFVTKEVYHKLNTASALREVHKHKIFKCITAVNFYSLTPF